MKYSIGQIVKIKATGEKVKIVGMNNETYNSFIPQVYYVDSTIKPFYEYELKSYCPSRTGTRDPKTGRFVGKCMRAGWCEACMKVHNNPLTQEDFYSETFTKEQKSQMKIDNTKMNNYLDSKQRNYQKIEKLHIGMFDKYDEVKEKINEIIDELGRRA